MVHLELIIIPGSFFSHPMKEKIEGISGPGRVRSKSLRPFQPELNVIIKITFEIIRVVTKTVCFYPFRHRIGRGEGRGIVRIIKNKRGSGVEHPRLSQGITAWKNHSEDQNNR